MSAMAAFELKQIKAYQIAEADGFLQHPDVYWYAAEEAETPPSKPVTDKLTVIEGIGPKIASLLVENGIGTFAELADTKPAVLTKILKAAGPRYAIHSPKTWPKQAKLARDGKTEALKKLQAKLKGGK